MKVCFISQYHFDNSLTLIKSIKEQGKDSVTCYLLFNEAARHGDIIDVSENGTKLGIVETDTARRIIHKDLGAYLDELDDTRLFVYSKKGVHHPNNYKLFYNLSNEIKKGGFDVIHIVGQAPFLLLFHLFLKRIPRVHTLHESIAHGKPESRINKIFLKGLSKTKSEFIFNSKITAARFASFTGINAGRVHCIPFGYFTIYRMYRSEIHPEPNMILFFGHIKPYKGVKYLIEAAPEIQNKIDDVRIVIAGRWAEKDLKETASALSYVEVIDKLLSPREITELIQRSTLVVCPYTSASQSGVINTSFAFFKPVIASNLEGINEVVINEKNGLLVQSENARAIVDGVVALLRAPEKLKEMESYIKQNENSPGFSWPTIADMTRAVYSKAISNHQSSQ